MPSRRRDGGEKSIQDIISLFKETDPDNVPAFAAQQLNLLPAVDFQHIESSLAVVHSKLEASDKTISELRAEVLLLRNSATARRSPPVASYVNTRRGAQNASIDSFESAVFVNAPPARVTASETLPSAPPDCIPRRFRRASRCLPPANNVRMQTRRTALSDKVHGDNLGFITVERKKKKPVCRNRCGTAPTGPSSALRLEIPTTLMYVSRVHYSVKAEDVADHLCAKTQFRLSVERLEPRHRVSFNSFVVRPTQLLSTFMKEDLWPKGILYRRFRGRLPSPVAPTSQSLRAS